MRDKDHVNPSKHAKPTMTHSTQFWLFLVLILGIWACAACIPDKEQRYQEAADAARSAFLIGKYREAGAYWQKALALKPRHAEPHRELASVWVRLGALDKAQDAFEQAVALQPQSQNLWHKLGQLCLLTRDTNCTQTCLSQLQPGSVPLHLLDGDIFLAAQELEKAAEAYSQALRLDPENQTALIRSAVCSSLRGKTDRAEARYEQLESMQAVSYDVHLQMADFWRLRGNPIRAEEVLVLAAQKDPTNLLLKERLAELYLDQEKPGQALEIIRTIHESAYQSSYLAKMEVDCLLSMGELEQAEDCLDQLMSSLSGEDPDALILQGKLALLRGKTAQAVSFLNSAVDMEPVNIQLALYLKGAALLRSGNVHLAKKAFVHALARDPNFTRAELALAGIHHQQHDDPTALEYLQRILTREPENAQAHLLQGVVLLSQGKTSEALSSLTDAARLARDLFNFDVFQGLIHERQGANLEAQKVYQAMLTSQRQHVVAVLGMIRLAEAGQGTLDPLTFFEDLSQDNPQEPLYRYGLGVLHARSGDMDKAVRDYQQAIHLRPGFAAPYVKLAELHIQNKDWESLVSVVNKGLDNQACNPRLYSQLAKGYLELGNMEQALEILEQGAADYPQTAGLLSNLAWMYLESGQRLEEAMNLAQKAYSLSPDDPAVADTLGWAFFKRDLHTRAIWLYEQALERQPDHPLVNYHLGLAWEAKGRDAKASEAFKMALESGLTGPEEVSAREKLAALRVSG